MSDLTPGASRRFSPAELDHASGILPADLVAETQLARELEALAARSTARPSAALTDRVMAVVAGEPSAAPARAAGRAIRRGSIGALLISIRDAWRVTVGRGFPVVIRAQALTLVLLVTALGAGTVTATAGALGLFNQAPSPVPNPSLIIPNPDASPSDSVDEVPVASPDGSIEPAEPSPSAEPEATTESAESPGTETPGDDNGGGSGGGSDDSSAPGSEDDSGGSDDRSSTPAPTLDAHEGSGDGSTPQPTQTVRPTDTPEPSGSSDDASPAGG